MNYTKRVWLNDKNSPSTGSIVCHDGEAYWQKNKKRRNRFVEVADCNNKATLHQASFETKKHYIKKVKKMRSALDDYIKYLETV